MPRNANKWDKVPYEIRKLRFIEKRASPLLLKKSIVAKLTLFGETFESSKNREIFKFNVDALTQIPNNKKFCHINFMNTEILFFIKL